MKKISYIPQATHRMFNTDTLSC